MSLKVLLQVAPGGRITIDRCNTHGWTMTCGARVMAYSNGTDLLDAISEIVQVPNPTACLEPTDPSSTAPAAPVR